MNRPVTPENKSGIYENNTVCETTNSVVVRIQDDTLPGRIFGIKMEDPQILPAGSEVTVFDAEIISLTGVNEHQSPANTAYRIEGKLSLTIYLATDYPTLSEINCYGQKFRQHSNLIPVEPSDCVLDVPLPGGTIVTSKESATIRGQNLPSGELFAIMSKAKTPKGQSFHPRKLDSIGGALYDLRHVRKCVHEFKVRNPRNVLVLHEYLRRVTQKKS